VGSNMGVEKNEFRAVLKDGGDWGSGRNRAESFGRNCLHCA